MITTSHAFRGLLTGTLVLATAAALPVMLTASAEQIGGGNRHRRPERGGDDAPVVCLGIVGTWRWFDGGTVTITSDLHAEWRDGTTNRSGHTAHGECDMRTGTVTLEWSNDVTDVIPRPGASSLQGRNNMGMTIWATRLAEPERQAPARTPAPRGPDRAPRDAPRTPAPPSTAGCARTFEELVDSGQNGVPPLLLADRLAKSPLPEKGIPDSLRGTGGSARVSTQRGSGAEGLCATVRAALAGSRAVIEYRVYAPRTGAPPFLVLLDEHAVFNERRFNNNKWQFCQFAGERPLSIACTWAFTYPGAQQQQVLAVAKYVATGGDTAAVEQVRQLAVAAQNHALWMDNRLSEEHVASMMAQGHRAFDAKGLSTTDDAGGGRRAGYRRFVPLILGLGALATLAGLALFVVIAVVGAAVYVQSQRRRRAEGPPA